jgi:hypothetical protein
MKLDAAFVPATRKVYNQTMEQIVLNQRYEVSHLLGGGGMAKVYLAHDGVLGRDVALKVLREQYAESEEFVERFRREATSAASLSHPNIVQVYDRGRSEDGEYYIAMEYVPGGTLGDRISREGSIEPREAATIVLQAAAALGFAHEHGVVHRDVKPHNILLTGSGDAKVADFGIVRAVAEATISRTSLVLGTASYMSPEQALGKPVGPRSDLYSLGVVLYEMLTGELPYVAESPVAVSMKHVNEPPHSPREANPGVPKHLDAITLKLLAKDPDDRYRDAAELAEDLARARDGLPPLAVGATAATAPVAGAPGHGRTAGSGSTRENWRGRFLPFALATLALLATLGLGWGLVRAAPEWIGSPGQEVASPDGAAEVKVPDVVGLAEDEARDRLAAEGLQVSSRPQESSREDAGRVLGQSPDAGPAGEGSRVTLTVGDGPRTVEVPNLAGLSVAAAEEELAAAGLGVGRVVEVSSDAVPAAQVIEQGIPAGTTVDPETAVNLTVSSGPPAPAPQAPTQQAAPQTPAQAAPPAEAPTQPAPYGDYEDYEDDDYGDDDYEDYED